MTVSHQSRAVPKRGAARRLSNGFIALLCLLSAPAAANAVDALAAFAPGTWQLGMAGGYARGFGAFGSDGTESEAVRMGALLPSVGGSATNTLGAGHWFEGGVSLLGEGQLLWNREPRKGFAGNAALVVRYHFLGLARHGFVPFVDGGAGLGSIDFDLDSQHDGFAFMLEGGVGMHVFLTPSLALSPSWRFHHLSNAGIRRPNVGINSQLFLLGVSLFFP